VGGPMDGVWAERPGATGVDCLDCRLSCSSSISAFASAIARFERVILRVVRRELCECSTAVWDLDCISALHLRRDVPLH
jgi:hypothetical protein